jgi:hypothetical protein
MNLWNLMERQIEIGSTDVSVLSVGALDSLFLSEFVSGESEDLFLHVVLKLGLVDQDLLIGLALPNRKDHTSVSPSVRFANHFGHSRTGLTGLTIANPAFHQYQSMYTIGITLIHRFSSRFHRITHLIVSPEVADCRVNIAWLVLATTDQEAKL